MLSRDCNCHFCNEHQDSQDKWTHKWFKPTAEVIPAITEHLSTTRFILAADACMQVPRSGEQEHQFHVSALVKECGVFTLTEKKMTLWSSIVPMLPENHFAFDTTTSVD